MDKKTTTELMENLNAYWGGPPAREAVIEAACEAFAHIPDDQIHAALTRLRKQHLTYPPAPAHIINEIHAHITRQVPALILEAIARYGSHRTDEARAALPELAWATVTVNGGWIATCQTPTHELHTNLTASLKTAVNRIIDANPNDPILVTEPAALPPRPPLLTPTAIAELENPATPVALGPAPEPAPEPEWAEPYPGDNPEAQHAALNRMLTAAIKRLPGTRRQP